MNASTSQTETRAKQTPRLIPIRLLPNRLRNNSKNITKPQKHSADDYMRFVADRFVRTGNNMLTVRKCTEESMSDAIVLGRLEFRGDCDLGSLMCIAPLCGRTFDSIQVLAYHLSYSHQNIRLTGDHEKCLVCGQNIGGEHAKRTHLLRKHNDLSKRHNEQCLEQRGTIISPESPAAKRIIGDRSTFLVSAFEHNSTKTRDDALTDF
ncbi:unnamed protein product, partial [Mesorhabditis belari]|uniref:C2H2-type domain-containing protein n=1 Tax=Mesorhabditis belari TaxID=2138241 RepID=A0AAF3E8V1_9BILA